MTAVLSARRAVPPAIPGPLLTDMGFHAMGDPQIGPGKAERFESHQRDTGRMRVSNRPEDAYAFRTPSLRNVTLTAPYGHAGAYASLEAYLTQHADPGAALKDYILDQAVLPAMEVGKPDLAPAPEAADFEGIAKAAVAPMASLGAEDRADILAFLASLEDPVAKAGGRMPAPKSVPSGLPVEP